MDVNSIYIKWNDSYSVGNTVIDSQHKHLIEIINKLYLLNISKSETTNSFELLNELDKYTNKHFGLEEKLLEKTGYTDLINHKKFHIEMKNKVKSLNNRLTEDGKDINVELLKYLKNWWLEHILEHDMKYSGVFKKQE